MPTHMHHKTPKKTNVPSRLIPNTEATLISTKQRTDKYILVYSYNEIVHNRNLNKLLLYIIWMNFTNMVDKRSQTRKSMDYMIPFTQGENTCTMTGSTAASPRVRVHF